MAAAAAVLAAEVEPAEGAPPGGPPEPEPSGLRLAPQGGPEGGEEEGPPAAAGPRPLEEVPLDDDDPPPPGGAGEEGKGLLAANGGEADSAAGAGGPRVLAFEVDVGKPPPVNLKVVVAGAVIGNVIEWYDFACYSAFSEEIARNFFPQGNEKLATLVRGRRRRWKVRRGG